MTRILTVKVPPVKVLRKTTRPSRPFGAGILSATRRFEPSTSDRSWAAQVFASDDDRRLDERATEAGWLERLEMGLCF